jgi:hypothetical protein
MARLLISNVQGIHLPSIVFVDVNEQLSPLYGHGFFNGGELQPDIQLSTQQGTRCSSNSSAAYYAQHLQLCPTQSNEFSVDDQAFFDDLISQIDSDSSSDDSSDIVEEILEEINALPCESRDMNDNQAWPSPLIHTLTAFDPAQPIHADPMYAMPVVSAEPMTSYVPALTHVPTALPESFQVEVAEGWSSDLSSPLDSPDACGSVTSPSSSAGSSASDQSFDVEGLPAPRRPYRRIAPASVDSEPEVPKYLQCVKNPDRKKTQNRDAAFRYRSKKKTETHTVETVVEGLRKRKQEAEERVAKRRMEVEYLENLLNEMN